MAHKKIDQISHDGDGIKAVFKIEYEAGTNANPVLDKIRQFFLWMDNPNQYKLDLDANQVITFNDVVLSVDQPVKDVDSLSVGLCLKSNNFEKLSTLFNLGQTGARTGVKFIELPEIPEAETVDTKTGEVTDDLEEPPEDADPVHTALDTDEATAALESDPGLDQVEEPPADIPKTERQTEEPERLPF